MRSDNLTKFEEIRNSLVQEKQELEAHLAEINKALGLLNPARGSGRGVTASGEVDRRKGPKSPEWKAAIAAAQKARWARIKGVNPESSRVGASQKGGSRQMTDEAKAKIAEAARRRWKQAKASGKNTL